MTLFLEILKMFGLVVLQNASFTLVSRARNSKSLLYHTLAAIGSNGIWLLVIREVIVSYNSWPLMVTYLVASVSGSVLMHYVAMKYFEKPKLVVQKPSIGRIVNYRDSGPDTQAAIITRVWPNGALVDLHVFVNNGTTAYCTGIKEGNGSHQWSWPKIVK